MAYHIRDWRRRDDKHVVMLSNHCCIRVQKQAIALRQKGWRVDSLSTRRPSNVEAFDYAFITERGRLTRALKESGASLIHVHNEPDRLMQYADEGANGRPVVYDCHDLEYHRANEVTKWEKFAFSRADGIINVGETYRDLAYSLHPWDVPSAVVHSLPLKRHIPKPPAKRDWAVVYEGGVTRPAPNNWRDFTVPCRVFAEEGIRFDLYTNSAMQEYYPNVKGMVRYDKLMAALGTYEFGWVGLDPAHPKLQLSYPNKVWEYAANGSIPLMVNVKSAAEYFGSGIVASSTREAIALMRECDTEKMRADVYAHMRWMDDEIDHTIRLYEELL